MAIYAIGDIHGCNKALKVLLQTIPKKTEDTFVFLGDYVNRGPKSKKVIKQLIKFSEDHNCIFLRGNHDILMMNARKSRAHFDVWMRSGGIFTIDSYKTEQYSNWVEDVGEKHWKFLDSTIAYYKTDEFIFVHAGLEKGLKLSEQTVDSLFWDKFRFPKKYSDKRIVVCGHTARKNGYIANFRHTICIDTGVAAKQWLSCLNLDTGEYYQANQKRMTRTGSIKIHKAITT